MITGLDGNHLAVLAAQLGVPMHDIGSECPLYLPDGSHAPKALDDQASAQGPLADYCGDLSQLCAWYIAPRRAAGRALARQLLRCPKAMHSQASAPA